MALAARALVGIAAAVTVLAPATMGGAAPATVGPVIDRIDQDCRQIPPEEMPPLATATGPDLELSVRVLFARGTKRVVVEHMVTTREAFARAGISLNVTYDRLTVPDAWSDSGSTFPDASADQHWELMKGHYGGERPPGVDVVYFFSPFWGGGLADCIGGVRFPDRAFAFGSLEYAFESIVPAPTVDEGVIAAHEIGHLLGAHHHYSNCTEAPLLGALEGEAAACTTMSPAAVSASAFFGLVERSFIRHFTEKYAQP
jgi:hypothetical protein